MSRTSLVVPLILSVLLVSGACGSVPKRNPVPPEFGPTAEIPGIPGARYWGDEAPLLADQWLNLPQAEVDALFPALVDSEHDYLALSGGGADGAFGAGLLNGWTEEGSRPEFDIVTGTSTGALIAPFAFLGPEYDGVLRKFYTSLSTKDIITMRSTLRGLTSDAVADSAPLKGLIAELITEETLTKIAAAHKLGRRLLVGTVNLDAMRPVVWNMGVIASSDHPGRLELFRAVLLASASIPGAFPPVFIQVEAGGETYDEIHVDGGTCAQVFFLPVGLSWKTVQKRLRVKSPTTIYVIRNSKVDPKWESVEPSIVNLAGRSISSLIRTQGLGNLFRIWFDARENGMEYRLANISSTFAYEPKEAFDTEYMKHLFDHGYQLAKSGFPWRETPPGYVEEED
jgi:hypothetical protein